MTPKDLLLGLAIIFLWGFNFIVIHWGLNDLTPMMLGGLRFLVIAVVGSFFFTRPKTPLKWIVVYALTLNFGQFAFLFTAMTFGMPTGLASLVLQSQAIFTLFFSAMFLKERVRAYQLLSITVAAAGLAIIGLNNGDTAMTVLGFAITLAAASSWALGNVVTKAIGEKGYDANLNLIVWACWVAPIPFFICAYFIDGSDVMLSNLLHINWQTMATLAYLSIGASIMGYGLWNYLMSRYSAGTVAPLALGVPVVGLTMAAILLDEKVVAWQWLGIVLVLLGLMMNALGGRFFNSKA
ncbi:EamA family transporter [Reinekea thalattae]|uniref:EamA family transporter n=1 Tax=Reinekea thalattae TaxID=2593301 RepID=A0A5C8Z8P9_9GAMM|nr:EamA family transporter [Reinekea thalattae]TXR53648.1 EamA family transporter [Reinekea thalattae]